MICADKLRRVIASADTFAQKSAADNYRRLFWAAVMRQELAARRREERQAIVQLGYIGLCVITVAIIVIALI